MKRILLLSGLMFFVFATANANPWKKNAKAWEGAFKAKNEVYTAPREEMPSPFVKNLGVMLDMSRKVALNNPQRERLNSPFYKNKKHRQAKPLLEVGEPQMVKK